MLTPMNRAGGLPANLELRGDSNLHGSPQHPPQAPAGWTASITAGVAIKRRTGNLCLMAFLPLCVTLQLP